MRPRVGPAGDDEDRGGGGQFRGILFAMRAEVVSKPLYAPFLPSCCVCASDGRRFVSSGPPRFLRRMGHGGTTARSTHRAHHRPERPDDRNRSPILRRTKLWNLRGGNRRRCDRPHSRTHAAHRVVLEKRHARRHPRRRDNASRSASTGSVVTGSAKPVDRGNHHAEAEYTPDHDAVRVSQEPVNARRMCARCNPAVKLLRKGLCKDRGEKVMNPVRGDEWMLIFGLPAEPVAHLHHERP